MTRSGSRGGFTLIELLVVISVLAVLMAIAVGAYFRVRAASEQTTTEKRLVQHHVGIKRQWSAVLDDAAKDSRERRVPAMVMSLAADDTDRARTLWTYFRLKNEFPQTFDEAWRDLRVANNTVLNHRSTFANASTELVGANDRRGVAISSSPNSMVRDYAMESAVLLHIIVTEKGNRGETFGDDALGAAVGEADVPYWYSTGSNGVITINNGGTSPAASPPAQLPTRRVKYLRDIWGKPIAFARWASNNELQGPPFTKTGTGTNLDPLDPLGKLRVTTWQTGAWQSQTYLWHAQQSLGTVDAAGNAAPFNIANINWIPTLISAGSDRTFDSVANFTGMPTQVRMDTDDILGYRLTQESQK